MLAFAFRRIVSAAFVMIGVAAVSFVLFQFVGDPVSQMLPMDATAEEREALTASLGLDEPFYVQFAHFLANAASGDFGISLRQARPVGELLLERLPATFELALIAVTVASVLGIVLGVLCAVKAGSVTDRVIMGGSILGISLPTFLIGILLILVFSVLTGWFPAFGRGEVVRIGFWTTGLATLDGWRHIALPAATLAVFQLALVIRLVRGEMLEVLRSDFIRFARARGLPDNAVHFGHALKNTLLPVITIIGLQFGGIIAFSIVTETVFQWPGLGLLFIQAVQFADIPVLSAYLVFIAFVFVVINFAVDAAYFAIDPRLRSSHA